MLLRLKLLSSLRVQCSPIANDHFDTPEAAVFSSCSMFSYRQQSFCYARSCCLLFVFYVLLSPTIILTRLTLPSSLRVLCSPIANDQFDTPDCRLLFVFYVFVSPTSILIRLTLPSSLRVLCFRIANEHFDTPEAVVFSVVFSSLRQQSFCYP